MNPQEEIERPKGTLIFAVILAVSTAWLAYRMPGTIQNFSVMFKGFGADLPMLTRAIIAIPYVWLLFAGGAIPLLAWIGVRNRVTRAEARRMLFALRVLLVVTLLAYGLAIVAMYLPIFKLGAVV